jgi:DUF971 family protein
MAGMTRESPQPTALTLHQTSRVLEIGFDDGTQFRIPFELMRVYSPSAEVQGHGPGQEVLQTGKREVGIVDLLLGPALPAGCRAGRALGSLRAAAG